MLLSLSILFITNMYVHMWHFIITHDEYTSTKIKTKVLCLFWGQGVFRDLEQIFCCSVGPHYPTWGNALSLCNPELDSLCQTGPKDCIFIGQEESRHISGPMHLAPNSTIMGSDLNRQKQVTEQWRDVVIGANPKLYCNGFWSLKICWPASCHFPILSVLPAVHLSPFTVFCSSSLPMWSAYFMWVLCAHSHVFPEYLSGCKLPNLFGVNLDSKAQLHAVSVQVSWE